MKNIVLVYNKESDSARSHLPEELKEMLSNSYSISLAALTPSTSINELILGWKRTPPDLILTFDFAGFDARTTGDCTAYNYLPVNILHYISALTPDSGNNLRGLFNFTMSFLVTNSSDYNTLKNDYPNIYDVIQISDIKKDLVSILSNMDWRSH